MDQHEITMNELLHQEMILEFSKNRLTISFNKVHLKMMEIPIMFKLNK
jgi:hypothetical protein